MPAATSKRPGKTGKRLRAATLAVGEGSALPASIAENLKPKEMLEVRWCQLFEVLRGQQQINAVGL